MGISEEDISFDAIEFYLDDEYDDKSCLKYRIPFVSRSFSLTLRDISKYNEVVNTLINSGITRVEDFEEMTSRKEELEGIAMAKALQDAKK